MDLDADGTVLHSGNTRGVGQCKPTALKEKIACVQRQTARPAYRFSGSARNCTGKWLLALPERASVESCVLPLLTSACVFKPIGQAIW